MANIFDVQLLNSIVSPKTPKLGLEPLYPNFGAPIQMEETDPPEYGKNLIIGNVLPYLKELTPTTDMGAMGITPQLAQGIMQQAPGFPLYDDMNSIIDTSYGVANEPDEVETEQYEVDQFGYRKKPQGIAKLFEVLGNIPTPFNLARRGLESLRGLNDRIQGSDFGQATSLMDYLDMRKYGGLQGRNDAAARTMAQARGITKSLASRPSSTSGGYQQGPGGSGNQKTSASKSQSQAGPGFSDVSESGSF